MSTINLTFFITIFILHGNDFKRVHKICHENIITFLGLGIEDAKKFVSGILYNKTKMIFRVCALRILTGKDSGLS